MTGSRRSLRWAFRSGHWFVFGWILVHCLKAACSLEDTAIHAAIATGACTLSLPHSTVDFSIQIQDFALPLTTLLGVGVAQSLAKRVPSG
jgi:hypothetical protein